MKDTQAVTVQIGGRALTIETGLLARQAAGATTVTFGDTVMFAAVTNTDKPREGIDYFPLQVEYREKYYAAGRFPGGFFKREARPSEKEIPTAVRHNSRGYMYQLSPTAAAASAAAPVRQPALQQLAPHSLQANAAAASPTAATAAGWSPQQVRLERATYDPNTDAAAAAATGAATGAGSGGNLQLSSTSPATQPAAEGAGASAGQEGLSSPAPQQTELLLQHMRAAGRRRLRQAVEDVASVLHQHWHSHQHQHQQQQNHLQQQTQLPQRSLSFILGKDERREVKVPPTSNTASSWPYSAVGNFVFQKGSCTGVMVGPGTVLTAAHCVYSRQNNKWQKDMMFVPHRHRQGKRIVEPHGRIPVDWVTTYKGW